MTTEQDLLDAARRELAVLERVYAIAKPAWSENPDLTIDQALKIMAERGSKAARVVLAHLYPRGAAH